MAVLIYAMLATAARASCAYYTGMHHAEQEIYLANTFCHEGSKTIRVLAEQFQQGQFITMDGNCMFLSRYLFKQKEVGISSSVR